MVINLRVHDDELEKLVEIFSRNDEELFIHVQGAAGIEVTIKPDGFLEKLDETKPAPVKTMTTDKIPGKIFREVSPGGCVKCGGAIKSKTGKYCPDCLLEKRRETQAKMAKERRERNEKKKLPPEPAEFNTSGGDDLFSKDSEKVPDSVTIEKRINNQLSKGVNQLPNMLMNIYGQLPERSSELWNSYHKVWLDVIYQDDAPEGGV